MGTMSGNDQKVAKAKSFATIVSQILDQRRGEGSVLQCSQFKIVKKMYAAV